MSLMRNLFRRRQVEDQLDAELRAYLDLLTDQKRRLGLSPADARRAALLEVGGVELVKEQCRDVRRGAWLNGFVQDVRYAVRGLRKSPGFTAVAVLSLALGIGANSAIFGMFYAAFLRPLPYPHAGRLFALNRAGFGVLTPELLLWRSGARAWDVAGWDDGGTTITGAGTPERMDSASVSSNFLRVLGVQPLIGRGFTDADGRPGITGSAILSYDLWQRKFAADAAIAGRTVVLDGKAATILGVMPPDFLFPGYPGSYRPDLLVVSPQPAQPDWSLTTVEGFRAIGRLHDGFTPQQGLGDLTALCSQPEMVLFLKNWGGLNTRVGLTALQEAMNGRSRPVLGLLLAAVCLLLLIACVNVASLQLGRAAARQRELGLRAALGASRLRLARLLIVENLVLSVLAGAAGFLAGSGLLHLLRTAQGLPIVGLRDLRPGWMLGGAALALATLGGLAMGLAPACLAPRLEFNQVLKSGASGAMGARRGWVRPALVMTQVALALVLLLGAGLLLRSLAGVLAVDPGFSPANVLTARLQLPNARYRSEAQQRAFIQQLLDAVTGLPGVESAGTANSIPLTNVSLGGIVRLEGEPVRRPGGIGTGAVRSSAIVSVTPQYFHTMRMRLLRGRPFSGQERTDGPPVVVVNALAARTFFGTEDVLGKHLQALKLGHDKPWWTIIGVVDNVRTQGHEAKPETELFIPESQFISSRVHVVLRARGDPLALAQGLRAAVWSLDKDMPVTGLATMEEMLSRKGAGRRAQTLLLSAFAFLALCLAAVGIYGVVSDAVNRRTREIGLRMALGARAGDVMRLVMRRSFLLALAGIAAGTGAGAWLVRYLASQLFGVAPGDPLTFGGAALVLLAVALAATYLPARRAIRIDPVAALRCE